MVLMVQTDYRKTKTSTHSVVHHNVTMRCDLTDVGIDFDCSGAFFIKKLRAVERPATYARAPVSYRMVIAVCVMHLLGRSIFVSFFVKNYDTLHYKHKFHNVK